MALLRATTKISAPKMNEVPRGMQNNAAVFVVSHHIWLLSKCMLA